MKDLPIFQEDESQLKRYYTIGEVADMFELNTSLIRFWEGEFDFLKPHKNSKGDRRFTLQNIEQLYLIYQLVRERGFTIEGARNEIERTQQWRREKAEVVKRLKGIREGLQQLHKKLNA